jgi:hypothetical protein
MNKISNKMKSARQKKTEPKTYYEQYQEALQAHDGAAADQAVIESIRKDPTSLREDWIINWLIGNQMQRNNKLIKVAFSPGVGEHHDKFSLWMDGLVIIDRVNELMNKGFSQERAFRELDGVILGVTRTSRAWDTIRNIYFDTIRKEPIKKIQETKDEYILTVYPAKIEMGLMDKEKEMPLRFYGGWSIGINKKLLSPKIPPKKK